MNTAAETSGHSPSAAWPAMSMDETQALLCADDAPFAMETVTIRGVPTRVWKHALPNLAELARTGRSHGDKTFLVYEDERVSFDGWFRAVAALADHLRGLGVGKGDRVALAMRNLPEWPVAFFAITAIGAICVPLNAWWTGPELAYGLADSGSKVLICDPERLARIAPHRADCPELERVLVSRQPGELPSAVERLEDAIGRAADYDRLPDGDLPETALHCDDPTAIFYTSGTTGNPKGAVITHRNLVTNILSSGYNAARTFLRRGEAPPEPTTKALLVVIPLFHCTACSAMMMGAVAAGHKLVFMHKRGCGTGARPDRARAGQHHRRGADHRVATDRAPRPREVRSDQSRIDFLWRRAVRARTGAQDPLRIRLAARQWLGHDRDLRHGDRDRRRGLSRAAR